MKYGNALLLLAFGLALITLIATVGAIASRKLNFKYTYLAILSILIYTGIGYLASVEYRLLIVIMINGLLGFYDATIGLRLSVINGANTGLDGKKSQKAFNAGTVVFMILFAIIFGIIGFGISKI